MLISKKSVPLTKAYSSRKGTRQKTWHNNA
jgi:hypothetical protein